MRSHIRLGDPTDHGGVVISGSPTYFIDGMPIARVGDAVTCPRPGAPADRHVTSDHGRLALEVTP